MTPNKRASFGLLGNIVIITIVAVVVIYIINGGLNSAFAGIINPIKKALGIESKEDMERQKEKERVEKELLGMSGKVYDEFKGILKGCMEANKDDRVCNCGTIDFTKLNNYYIELTKSGDAQFLELKSPERVLVKDKQENLGNFNVGPVDVTNSQNNFRTDSYRKPNIVAGQIKQFGTKSILLSKDKATFNAMNGEIEKSNNRMNSINIMKLNKDTIAFDESNNGLRICGTPINCAKNFIVYYESNAKLDLNPTSLPSKSFQVCKEMNDPNLCYQYNDQYIPNSPCIKIESPKNAIGCSTIYDPNVLDVKQLLKNPDLTASAERNVVSGEDFTRFKYVYPLSYKLKDLSLTQRDDIYAEVVVTDTVKPFEENDNSDQVSLFTTQLFNKFYNGKDIVLVVLTADSKAEAIISGTANELLKSYFSKNQCAQFLEELIKRIAYTIEKNREMQEQKAKRALEFFNDLVSGFENCVSQKSYSETTISGIIGACNCGVKLNINDLSDYKIAFKTENLKEAPFWRTTFSLKDKENNELFGNTVNSNFYDFNDVFEPCQVAKCQTKEANLNKLRSYAINDELWLSKAKGIENQISNEILFFGDQNLPDCQS